MPRPDYSRTPVIIPAFNEGEYIGKTLDALPARVVQPIVAVNGSTDRTAQIAEGYGARILNISEQGKLPAIQKTLERLGNSALDPLIILDADTRPLIGRLWHRGMMGNMLKHDDERPVAVGGPIVYTEGGFVNDAVKSLMRAYRARQSRVWDDTKRPGQCGPHMGLHFKNSGTLEEVLAIPHLWPGEDFAIVETVLSGDGHYYQPISPAMMAVSPSSETYPHFIERMRIGGDESRRRIQEAYVAVGAPGSISYQEYTEQKKQADSSD